jgi:Family of unknown function (DUF6069)
LADPTKASKKAQRAPKISPKEYRMTSTSSVPEQATGSINSWSTLGKGAVIGGVAALLANLAAYFVGNLGAPLQVVANGSKTASDLAVGNVIGASIIPVLFGMVGLWGLNRFRSNGFTLWTALVGLLTVISLLSPLVIDVANDSKATLLFMHLATGLAAFFGQKVSRTS